MASGPGDTQRFQNPLIQEYTLTHIRVPIIIERYSLIRGFLESLGTLGASSVLEGSWRVTRGALPCPD